ncbi:MAG: tandem-95 repeat protein [Flavobacteriales bacterium]|nr:tandem-95 repeat protein [Flavobacteriales bacterium]
MLQRFQAIGFTVLMSLLAPYSFAQIPPTAIEDEVFTYDSESVSGDLSDNDLNPSNSTLTYTLLQETALGELTVNPDGTWIFVADPYVTGGNEAVVYQVCDQINQCSQDTIWVYVQFHNNVPQPSDDYIFVEVDTPRFGDATLNDFEPDYLTDPVSGFDDYANTSNPLHGDVIMLLDGTFQYTPDPGYTGPDSFYYVMCDPCGACAAAVVYITVVGNNEEPVASNSPVLTLTEDTDYNGDISGLVTDPEGDVLTFSVLSSPSHGVVMMNNDGTFTYSPDQDFHGTDNFMYLVCDMVGQCVVAFVYLDVQDANDAPIALNDNMSVIEDSNGNNYDASSNDLDETPATLTYDIYATPLHGSANISVDGTITYAPVGNYNGPDYFVIEVCDGFLLCDTSSVYVTVTPSNDPPTSVLDDYYGYEDEIISGTLDNDMDIDGDELTYSLVSSVTGGTFNLNANGTFTFNPSQNYAGYQVITYQVCDPSMACTNGTLNLEVIEINDNPVINADVVSGNEDSILSGNLRTNDIEPDGEEIFYFTVTSPEHGTLDLSDDGVFTYTPDDDWYGQEVVSYYGCDPCSVCFLSTLTLNVQPMNDVPVLANIVINTNEDITYNSNIATNASDIEAEALSFSIITSPQHGTMNLTSVGQLSFVPDFNYNGPDLATYAVCDASGGCDTANVSIVVAAVNDPPVASDMDEFLIEDGILNGAINTVVDIDDVVLHYAMISPPMHGTMLVNDDGTFTYEPADNYNGIDFITFEACDDDGACDAAVLTLSIVTVNDIPVANDDANVTYENDVLQGSVAENDLDVDLENLTYTVVQDALHGEFVLDSNGEYTYTPEANFNGVDEITYMACDATLSCDMAVLTITIFPVNTAPTAGDASFNTNEDVAISNNLNAFISDVEGGVMEFSTMLQPIHGTLVFNINGSFTYTPALNYNGPDQFTYQVCDTGDACDQAVVNINISAQNDAPNVADEEEDILEDGAYMGNVAANDSDVENDELTYQLISPPASGNATMDGAGNLTYTPIDDFFGDVMMVYEACDAADCTQGEIIIHVAPVNDAPVAQNDNYSALEDVVLNANVSMNDTDIDDVTLNYTLISDVSNGTLNLALNGSFSYLADQNFNGNDSFTYQVCDNGDLCSTAVVNIVVDSFNDLPVAGDDVFNLEEDQIFTGVLWENDVDPENTTLTYSVSIDAEHGNIELNSDGSFTYTPDMDFFGQDNIVISVCDALDGCVTSDMRVLISPVNDLPEAIGEAWTLDEDDVLNANVSGNDTDVESLLLEYNVVASVSHGILSFGQDGAFTYSPDGDYYGEDNFTYEVCDDDNGCSQATVNLMILPMSDNPVAGNEYVHVLEDTFGTGDLATNDFDADNDVLSYSVLTPPFHGEFILDIDGQYTYTPEPDYSGMDSVYYNVCDPTNMCDIAKIVFEVDFGNDTPIAFDDAIELEQDSQYSGTVADNDVEPDGEVLYYTLYLDNSNGIFSLAENGSFTYIPNDGVTGTFSVTYYACDPCGVCDAGVLTIVVVPIGEGNTAPVAFNVTQDVCMGGSVSVDLDSYVGDIQDVDANLHFTVEQPSHGIMTFDETTHIMEYLADTDNTSDVSLGFTVCDNGLVPLCTSALINLQLQAIVSPEVASVSVHPVSCYGAANGSIDLNMQSGQSGLSYLWSNEAVSEDIENLTPGDYSVIISNDENCAGTTTLEFTIEEPALLEATLVASSNINDAGNGAIDINIAGGVPPYTIAWTGPDGFSSQNEDVSDLLATGIYNAVVSDSLGCSDDIQIEITGLNEHIAFDFIVSPNPFVQSFTIKPAKMSSHLISYQITDATGRVVRDVKVNGNAAFTVDASELSSGCYQLRLNTGEGAEVISLIKQ